MIMYLYGIQYSIESMNIDEKSKICFERIYSNPDEKNRVKWKREKKSQVRGDFVGFWDFRWFMGEWD
jgi:hypothetical protein